MGKFGGGRMEPLRWRLWRLAPASLLLISLIPDPGAAAEISGKVTASRESEVRVDLDPSSTQAAGPTIAPGDLVRFTTTMDGFELDAGSGKVTEVGDGFVWVGEVDARVQPGMDARIVATGAPRGPTEVAPSGKEPAADDPRLVAVVRGHTEARGDAWESVRTLSETGQSQNEAARWKFTSVWRRPDTHRLEILDRSGDFLGIKALYLMLVEPGHGWWHLAPILEDMGRAQKEGGDVPDEVLERQSLTGSVFQNIFEHWAEVGYELRFAGEETIRGRRAYRVDVDAAGFAEAAFYFDAESYQLVRTRVRPAGGELQVTTFDDFRRVRGLWRPYSFRVESPSGTTRSIVTEVQVNPDLPDHLFERP